MTECSDFMVTLNHLHSVPAWGGRAGFCHRGARELAARYGIDWAEIVRNGGIPASRLISTGDALAVHLVEFAKQEVSRGQ